jgi:hypothetical protein
LEAHGYLIVNKVKCLASYNGVNQKNQVSKDINCLAEIFCHLFGEMDFLLKSGFIENIFLGDIFQDDDCCKLSYYKDKYLIIDFGLTPQGYWTWENGFNRFQGKNLTGSFKLA